MENDVISRAWLLEQLQDLGNTTLLKRNFIALVENAPAVDGVKIVRCKDCRCGEQKKKLCKHMTSYGACALTEEPEEWVPVRERLPENAGRPGALCPVYLVATKYGVTEGWYNPDARGWFIIMKRLTGLYDGECDINFERGDVVRVEYVKDGLVTHWMPLPPAPEVADDLRELAEADKDGRVVVLPCKVEDMLYEVTGRKTISVYKVKAIRVDLFGLFIEWDIVEGFVWQYLNGINANEIGKTVFLSREEAEKALQEMEGKEGCAN